MIMGVPELAGLLIRSEAFGTDSQYLKKTRMQKNINAADHLFNY